MECIINEDLNNNTAKDLAFLSVKIESLITLHNMIDNTLKKFDEAGIPPIIEEIDEFRQFQGLKADLTSDLKLCLEAIQVEANDIEGYGFIIKSLSKGIVTWSQNNIKYEWNYFKDTLKSQTITPENSLI